MTRDEWRARCLDQYAAALLLGWFDIAGIFDELYGLYDEVTA